MLLRSSITTTKKFFQKTLKNFKSLFSSEYQRLPKSTPQHNNYLSYSVASTNVMMDMNTDFNDQWESENEKARRRGIKKKDANNGSYMKLSNNASPSFKEKRDKEYEYEYDDDNKKQNNNKRRLSSSLQRGKQQKDSSFKYCMVEEKLRELEMMDVSNVDYVMDIEEVLHYYSRLTCPAYLEIVDKFFMELFGPAWPSTTPCSVNYSRMKLRYQ